MSLSNASRALEIVDTRLTATQSKLLSMDPCIDPEQVDKDIDKIVDHLDLILSDLRAAAGYVAEHDCTQGGKRK